ncbi:MAG: hypothetical protein Q9166_004142 [cf. Caloplaca sp. 2 TL-2023]
MLLEWQPRHYTNLADSVIPPLCILPPQVNPSPFHLTTQAPDSQRSLKRIRLQADVEGEDSVDIQRKKRRLRVDLVTSRLSQPYASPATHIISSHRRQRLGPWARPRYRVRSPLRRAAIFNAIRVRKTMARQIGHKEVHLLTRLGPEQESDNLEIDLVIEGIRTTRDSSPKGYPPQHHVPPLPSPLGPSSYDAFDEEEDPFDENDTEINDEEDGVYSNFNELDGTDADIEDYDSLCPFGGGIKDYSRPWKSGTTGDDMHMEMANSQLTDTGLA